MICLLAGSAIAPLMAGAITLAWTHSVEKIVWEEDWRSTPAGLELVEARVRGSGAGMEPPPEARLVNGVWSWKPGLPPQMQVIMRRSGATADLHRGPMPPDGGLCAGRGRSGRHEGV